jgi:predicted P-loop ATPase
MSTSYPNEGNSAFSNQHFLSAAHQKHIEGRGLLNDWSRSNCRTITAEEASLYLGYPAKSGGILFVGKNEQIQFKPDRPWRNGKSERIAPKYRSPLGDFDAYVPVAPDNPVYWEIEALKREAFYINGHPYIVLTEGVFKAIAGCSNGLPTISLLGVEQGLTGKKRDVEGKRYLVQALRTLAEAGFGFIIAFDADAVNNPNISIAAKTLAKQLAKFNVPVRDITGDWEPGENGEFKGLDDFIEHKGFEEFRAILVRAKLFGEKGTSAPSVSPVERSQHDSDLPSASDSLPARSKTKRAINQLDAQYGHRLRFNEMSQQVELDGKPCKLDTVYLAIAKELDIDVKKEQAVDILSDLALSKAYSPVQEYLNSVAGAEPINLDELALRYFGNSDPFQATLLKKTLIAAVARAFAPGCKHDTLCILQGEQGWFKSEFWAKLAAEFFTDNLNDANEKDEKLKLRRYWILEYSEFETVYKRKEVEQLKAFLSSRIDSIRKPYGRAVEDFPRTSIFVGTTNRQEFLQDPTGERRYWVIAVQQRIPIELLNHERDRIWGEAVRLYRAGINWWLGSEEDAVLAKVNQGWQVSDLWESAILGYLKNRTACTVPELLEKAISLDLAHSGKREEMRVSDILRRYGWQKTRKRVDGQLQRFWEKAINSHEVVTKVVTQVVTPLKPCQQTLSTDTVTEVVTEVVTPLNPCEQTLSTDVLPPVTTFYTNKLQNIASDVATNGCNVASNMQETFENGGGHSSAVNNESLSQQEFEAVTTPCDHPPENLPTFADAANLNDGEAELVQFIHTALANNDVEFAGMIQEILQDGCKEGGGAERGKVWAALTTDEQSAFRALLAQIEIDLADVEKMREIASIWWQQYYPQDMQSLITQMFGWDAPGRKYIRYAIKRWLKNEDVQTQERIAELLDLKENLP